MPHFTEPRTVRMLPQLPADVPNHTEKKGLLGLCQMPFDNSWAVLLAFLQQKLG